jgi:phospholipase/carboxylesterase
MNEDWFALLLGRLFGLPCRFVIPRAPLPLPARGGKPAASWYDYDGDQPRFLRELARVEAHVLDQLAQIETAMRWTPRERLILGFSQGGYAGAFIALRHPERFGGLIVSGARVKTEALAGHLDEAARSGIQVLLCHGRRDRLVSPEAAERSHLELAARGVRVTSQTFEGGHTLDRRQITCIAAWIRHSILLSRE